MNQASYSNDKTTVTRSTTCPVKDNDSVSRRMIQNILVVWLNTDIDENSIDWQNKAMAHLRHAANTIEIFNDGEKCVQFLKHTPDEQICLIVTGSRVQQIVPRVHNLSQVNSVFIFCDKKIDHAEWIKDWSKIRDVFITIEPLRDALKQTTRQCEQNSISISIMSGGDNIVEKNGNRLDPSFMYTQIMKEIFLTMDFEQQHMDQFIQYCRATLADSESQLKSVDQLAQEYSKHTPIWWYTRDIFLYPMLNRALRVMDADLIIKLGFFLKDLHRQIKKLHQEQCDGELFNQQLVVFRGQGMNKETYEKMIANKGGLLSFNNLLSTSSDPEVASMFAESSAACPNLFGVLFVISIDSAQSSTPFAFVNNVGYFGSGEDEVLFSMHSVFRIEEIEFADDTHRFAQVQLKLASDKDNDLCQLIEHIRNETFPTSKGWHRLCLILLKMGQSVTAEELYETKLRGPIDQHDTILIYHHLGFAKNAQGKYADAITYYEKMLEITPGRVSPVDLSFSAVYNNLGLAYIGVGDYQKALLYLNKALKIREQLRPPILADLASSYTNMGIAYKNMGEYRTALSYYEKDLTISEKLLPPAHPDLASSYNNIGLMYESMHHYPKALLSYEKALAIQRQSLPPMHHDFATSYNHIGNVYYRMDDYPKARFFLEKIEPILQQSFPSTHPDLAKFYLSIGSVYKSMKLYSKAFSSFEKALTIQRQSSLFAHPDIPGTYYNMGLIHGDMGNYWKAQSYLQHAVDIARRLLPIDHPHLLMYRRNLRHIKKISKQIL